MYTAVFDPTLTYAAVIWGEAAKSRAGRSLLRSTQRKFCINTIHGFRTTPTLTSIALMRTLPLDLKYFLPPSLHQDLYLSKSSAVPTPILHLNPYLESAIPTCLLIILTSHTLLMVPRHPQA
ncbi:hypothetical protein LAZ67_7000900 [Cordylochernes scorpioides]|uniref:RNA-directed DNA polymerase from mobile element jockey n=1 Tax=Cordylochernes scorpioides TaxID=51811 RepID=A0ABY6KNP4_9ARAC|nr:hypothetical protein LAZ67_7000900 [Cordylochernes scorpioides]